MEQEAGGEEGGAGGRSRGGRSRGSRSRVRGEEQGRTGRRGGQEQEEGRGQEEQEGGGEEGGAGGRRWLRSHLLRFREQIFVQIPPCRFLWRSLPLRWLLKMVR